MSAHIKAFYIENFKAIRKGRWFDFADLSLLTGANSSGKSTLFKAIEFFGKMFMKSDLPVVRLDRTAKIGSIFPHLVNDYGGKDEFTLGFRYHSPFFGLDLDAFFVFAAYDDINNLFVPIIRLEHEGKPLLTIYDSHQVEELTGFVPVLYDYNDPSVATVKAELDMLEQYLPESAKPAALDLFGYLRSKFGNEWTLESVSSDLNGTAQVQMRYDTDVYSSLLNDFYCNLYDRDEKLSILTKGDKHAEEAYDLLSKKVGYQGFIEAFFKPLFDELSNCLVFFHGGHIMHIDFGDSMLARVIHHSNEGDFLPLIGEEHGRMMLSYCLENTYGSKAIYSKNKKPVYDDYEPIRCGIRENFEQKLEEMDERLNAVMDNDIKPEFIHEPENRLIKLIADSLLIFDLKKGIEIDKPINGANIIYILEEHTLKQLADIGRGEARIICMILMIAYRLFDIEKYSHAKPAKNMTNMIVHIEEPEAYLHPKWQSRLADYFVFLVSTFEIQLIIETHSVYLIQRLQLMVARKQIKPKDIIIRYFETAKEDIRFRNISIRPDGMLKGDFGTGFFDESDLLTRALLNQQSPN